MKKILTLVCLLGMVQFAPAQDKKDDKPEEPKGPKDKPAVVESAADDAPERSPLPPVDLVIFPGEAVATPHRKGVSWANGGVVDVSQPNPTTIVVTMSGLCATNADMICTSTAGYHFDLNQCFGVRFNSRKVKGGAPDDRRPRHGPAADEPRVVSALPVPARRAVLDGSGDREHQRGRDGDRVDHAAAALDLLRG